MKKFWIQLGASFLVGGCIAVGLFLVVPNWTRADMFSVFAVIVSIWQVAVTRWEAIPSGELARLQLQKEKNDSKKALLNPVLEDNEEGNHSLRLTNTGRCEARNVRVYLDAVPIEEHRAFVQFGRSVEKIRIGVGAHYSYLLGLDKSCLPPFDLDAQWEDDYQDLNVYSTTLTW